MKFIYNYRSPNFNNRKKGTTLKYIILHYTAMQNYNEAIEISNTLLNIGNNYNNTDLIYNIGVFYQNYSFLYVRLNDN